MNMPESNHIFTDLGIPYMDTVTGSFAAQTPAKTLFSPDQKRKLRARSLTELRADFQHLRRWRKSVEQAQSYTFKAVITVIVTGLVGAAWLGVKVVLGKGSGRTIVQCVHAATERQRAS